MPIINADDGCPLNVEVSGAESAPVLMLSNSLGTDLTMWDDQAGEFGKHFRLIRYDRRGHGKSGAAGGPLQLRPLRPRHSRHHRRAQGQDRQLVRPVHGRHGRAMARRQCARPRRQARARQHALLLPRQVALDRPHQIPCARTASRRWSTPIWSAGSPRGFSQRAPRDDRAHEDDVPRQRPGRLCRLLRGDRDDGLPRQQPTHQRADAGHRRQPGSPRRRRNGRRDDRAADSGRQGRQRSTPRIFPMSSSPRPSPRPC